MQCVYACDIDPTVRETFRRNFGFVPEGDITEIDAQTVPDHDVLCAGFPCQPFSVAGLKKGFEDIRGSMFGHIMRIVTEKTPAYVVLENVPALLIHDDGNTFAIIRQHLGDAGYDVDHVLLRCSDFGIPQRRKRVFIVATRGGYARPDISNWDAEKRHVTLSEFTGRNFEREVAFTIRCGARGGALRDRHNWTQYIVDGCEHTLTIDEALRLQGFEDYELHGGKTAQWRMLGNTIPTNLTRLIGERIVRAYHENRTPLPKTKNRR